MGKRIGIGKGTPGPGRPKGLPNKTTRAAKEAFAEAFERMGGVDALVEWAEKDDNKGEFFKLYARLIPVDVTSGGESLPVPVIVMPGDDE
jgi:hypothetical protein